MSITSTSRMAVPALAIAAASVAALVFGIAHLRREPPVEITAATPAPAILPPASGPQDQDTAVLATAQAEAIRMAALPASPRARLGQLAFDENPKDCGRLAYLPLRDHP